MTGDISKPLCAKAFYVALSNFLSVNYTCKMEKRRNTRNLSNEYHYNKGCNVVESATKSFDIHQYNLITLHGSGISKICFLHTAFKTNSFSF